MSKSPENRIPQDLIPREQFLESMNNFRLHFLPWETEDYKRKERASYGWDVRFEILKNSQPDLWRRCQMVAIQIQENFPSHYRFPDDFQKFQADSVAVGKILRGALDDFYEVYVILRRDYHMSDRDLFQ